MWLHILTTPPPHPGGSGTETSGFVLVLLLVAGLVVYLGLALAAIISILRSGHRGSMKFLLVLAVLGFPLLGSLVWLLGARHDNEIVRRL